MRLRFVFILFVALLAIARASAADAEEPDAAAPPPADDLLCAHAPAGSVERVPAPFDHWLVLVCAPQSQALVPVEGTIWFSHGTAETVSILALPPDTMPIPKTDEYDPRYNVRFKALYATEAKDGKRERALSLLETALANDQPPQKAPKIDRIFQLDAVSSIYGMRYNIYFYVSGGRPRSAIACIDQCKQALLMDIMTVKEAAKRLSGR
ncbi:MAG TPA: hypothetical protein VGN05_13115 [Parvibaculum sp.]|jgi:hypothetical protein